MKSSWKKLPLGDLSEIKGGKRLPKGKNLLSEKNSHPYIRVKDMHDGFVSKNDLLFVPDDVFPKISRYIINKDDVFISIVGTIGLVGIIDAELDGANLTENAAKISIVSKELLPKFLVYYLSSHEGQYQINSLTVGTTQPKLALNRIEKIKVPVPPLIEQEKIVEILSSFDDKIELNRQINQTLEAMARAIFKSWFVDFDPVYAKMEGRDYPLPLKVLVESELEV
jgi:type I restriction enzyme S subunit